MTEKVINTHQFRGRTCVFRLVLSNPQMKLGAPLMVTEDSVCPSECPGLQTETRFLGGIALPSIFDRAYCPTMSQPTKDESI